MGADGWRSRYTGNQVFNYTFDASGDLAQRQLVGDTDALAQDSAVYAAYGALLGDLDTSADPYARRDPVGFGGQWGNYTDVETGLLCLTHRYYDPATGRFVSRDPIDYAGGENLYGYAGNNPVNETDPNGTNPFEDFWNWLTRPKLRRGAATIGGAAAENRREIRELTAGDDEGGVNSVIRADPRNHLSRVGPAVSGGFAAVGTIIAVNAVAAPFGGEGKVAEEGNAGLIAGTQGLRHSFDRHAAQWFGQEVTETSHLANWQSLVERAAKSSLRLNSRVGASPTTAYLARIDGKWFVAHFFRDGDRAGELATAFVPGRAQVRRMLRSLGK